MRTMRTSIALTFILLFTAGSLSAQNLWHEGIVNTKSTSMECKLGDDRTYYVINRVCTDKRVDLPWGIDPNRGQVSVTINSERHLYNAIATAISKKKLMAMVEAKENYFNIFFDLTETGEIIKITFTLKNRTLITPNEVATMDSLIRENLKFKVVSNFDFGEPHMYLQSFFVKTIEVLNGEIKPAKKNEMSGKQYWETDASNS